MTLLAVSAFLAQASPSAQPSVVPAVSSAWTTAPPPDKHYYAHYVRKETDGSQSLILGRLDICDCQPASDADLIQTSALRKPGVNVARSQTTVCGQQAERLIITGQVPKDRNAEILLFRDGDAMIILIYSFDLTTPLPEDEAMLFTVCPKES